MSGTPARLTRPSCAVAAGVTPRVANTASKAAVPEEAGATASRTPVASATSTVPVRAAVDGETLSWATPRSPTRKAVGATADTPVDAVTLPVLLSASGRRRIPASRAVVMMSLPPG